MNNIHKHIEFKLIAEENKKHKLSRPFFDFLKHNKKTI